jgi:hypothetical protein
MGWKAGKDPCGVRKTDLHRPTAGENTREKAG